MTAEQITITKALIRLSRHKLGAKESCLLMLTSGGATTKQIAKAAGQTTRTTQTRMHQLRRKRLVKRKGGENNACHTAWIPTEFGLTVIKDILNIKH